MADPRDELQTTLGSAFTIERELGGGGMSRVFVANDTALGRKVVVKLLPPELGSGLSMERFKREIALAASLQHPHIVPLFSAGDVNGLPFFTMPFIEGETLRARLAKHGEMPVHEAVRVLREVASALDYAHEKGVVHRDIKPENVVLSRGSAMVLDFGVAKALSASSSGAGNMTSIGIALGTPAYMSPEQASADPNMDHRADIYSFGVLAYELLTGQTPFSGRTPQAMLAAQVTEAPEDISRRRSTIPPALAALVMKCLEKRAADRPQSASQILIALDALATPTAGLTPASSAPAKHLNRTAMAVVAATAIVAAVVAAWRGSRASHEPLDIARVAIMKPRTDAALSGLAQSLSDVLARDVGQLTWAKVVDAPDSNTTSVGAFARKLGAGTVAAVTLTAIGDSVTVKFQVFDGTSGQPIRALDAVRVSQRADAAELSRAADPMLTELGYVTNADLGAAMLPAGPLPKFAAFREFALGYNDIRKPEFAVRRNGNARLASAWELDTAFYQARLWRAFFAEWNGSAARVAGAAQLIDSVTKELAASRRALTPFEAALGDMVRASAVEVGDPSLNALRQMAALAPTRTLQGFVESFLVDLNRPREAIANAERALASVQALDSASGEPRRLLENLADLYHYVGDGKNELAAAARARRFAPNSLQDLRLELRAQVAVGDTAAVRKELDQVEASASEGRLFQFPGDVYLQTGQELVAHGYPAYGKVVIDRAAVWLGSHLGESAGLSESGVMRPVDLGLRAAIALDATGRLDSALTILRKLASADATDTRIRGYMGRIYAAKGDTAAAAGELAWLAAKPAAALQGAPTYERAAINARLGRAHWDVAVELLGESLRQGQGFGIRRRLHYFGDWIPLHDYPPFKQLIEPRG